VVSTHTALSSLHPLAGIQLTQHAIARYEMRRTRLGIRALEEFTAEEEIRLLLALSTPCIMPPKVIAARARIHGVTAEYWHTHPFRFIVVPEGKSVTIELDTYPREWHRRRFVIMHGFTVKEIVGEEIAEKILYALKEERR
jgi:hypothetical protein